MTSRTNRSTEALRDVAPPAPAAQPHLPGQSPTELDKVTGIMRTLEDERGAEGEKLTKARARHDDRVGQIDRELELLRRYRDLLAERAALPNPVAAA